MRFIPIYSRFIAGTNLQSAIKIANMLKQKRVNTIFDYSVESPRQISRNINEIFHQIEKIDSSFIALKFSALGIENVSNCEKLIDQFYLENNKKQSKNRFLIDAENYEIQPKIYALSDYAIDKYNTLEFKPFYKTLQMYRNDVWPVYMSDIEKYMVLNKYAVKLVRGAYIKTDGKYGIINSTKEKTDEQYNFAIDKFFSELHYNSNNEMMVATHNKESFLRACGYISSYPVFKNKVSFATLYGMADGLCYPDANIFNKYKYLPYGPFLETTPYLFRRLVENVEILKHL